MSATTPTPEQLQRAKCGAPGCEGTSHGHGFCPTHYARWRRYGSPLAGGTPKGAAASFIATAIRHAGDDCLLWPYAKSPSGYGHIKSNGRYFDCHVLVCESTHGVKPTIHHEAAHSCGVRLCCNPAHLRWATSKENKADNLSHGTLPWGERHWHSKLTNDQVLAIRSRLADATDQEIANYYKVNRGTIFFIRRGITWKHLP